MNSRDVEFNGQTAELVAAHDVTYRVRGERAIVDEAHRVKALLAAVPMPYWVIDQEGKLLDVNEQYCHFGLSTCELIGTYITTLLANDSGDQTKSGTSPLPAATLKRKDGSRHAATLVMNQNATNEHAPVILIQPREDDAAETENGSSGSCV